MCLYVAVHYERKPVTGTSLPPVDNADMEAASPDTPSHMTTGADLCTLANVVTNLVSQNMGTDVTTLFSNSRHDDDPVSLDAGNCDDDDLPLQITGLYKFAHIIRKMRIPCG